MIIFWAGIIVIYILIISIFYWWARFQSEKTWAEYQKIRADYYRSMLETFVEVLTPGADHESDA